MAGEPQFQVRIDDQMIAGVYCNIVQVWHSPYEFTLDFGVADPPQQDEQGNVIVPVMVTARVRVPVAVVFPLLRALEGNITKYESRFGSVPTGSDNITPDMITGEGENDADS
jgi:hypothetical protein